MQLPEKLISRIFDASPDSSENEHFECLILLEVHDHSLLHDHTFGLLPKNLHQIHLVPMSVPLGHILPFMDMFDLQFLPDVIRKTRFFQPNFTGREESSTSALL